MYAYSKSNQNDDEIKLKRKLITMLKDYKNQFKALVLEWWNYNSTIKDKTSLFQKKLEEIKKKFPTPKSKLPNNLLEREYIRYWEALIIKFAEHAAFDGVIIHGAWKLEKDQSEIHPHLKTFLLVYENSTNTLFYNTGREKDTFLPLETNPNAPSYIYFYLDTKRKTIVELMEHGLDLCLGEPSYANLIRLNKNLIVIPSKLYPQQEKGSFVTILGQKFTNSCFLWGTENKRFSSCPYTKKTLEMIIQFS